VPKRCTLIIVINKCCTLSVFTSVWIFWYYWDRGLHVVALLGLPQRCRESGFRPQKSGSFHLWPAETSTRTRVKGWDHSQSETKVLSLLPWSRSEQEWLHMFTLLPAETSTRTGGKGWDHSQSETKKVLSLLPWSRSEQQRLQMLTPLPAETRTWTRDKGWDYLQPETKKELSLLLWSRSEQERLQMSTL
jgi:hypothetical protein